MGVNKMNPVGSHLTLFRLLSTATVLALLMFLSQTGLAGGQTGDIGNVYVLTNQPDGNRVMVFHRNVAGMLMFAGSFASGGNGAGTGPDPLGSQGAVVLSEDNRLLFAVNAGSNSISVFAVSGDQLALLGTVSSGGILPVSLAVQLDLVYVLNAGGTPNISGFTIDPATDQLVPLAGSTQALPGGATADPAQVSFTPDGSVLVVTEKGTNLIDTFAIDDGGVAQPGVSFPSEGPTPFGFAFGHNNIVIVSEAFGSAPGASALSSYEVDVNGNLVVVTSSLGDAQTAACWVVVLQNGLFAYTSNTGSDTISSYTVSGDGSLALLNAAAASTGEGSLPIDMDLSNLSRFLYVRNGNGTISGFRVEADGSLTPVTIATGLPDGAQGIAAR
jgi:6-phosphogluconolactonase (cycloisomerase 2 family)